MCIRDSFMDDAFLHPDALHADPDGRVHDIRNVLRTAEDVHHIHRFRDLVERRIRLFAEHLGLRRIHRNDPICLLYTSRCV